MKNTDILVIGAGATGLMAAYTLSKSRKKVVVLEARNRVGGRIHTLKNESFFKHAELGAEFVHGNLPVTLNLLKEAGIEYTSAEGEFWHCQNGEICKEQQQTEGWGLLMQKLSQLKEDCTIDDFLQEEFGDNKYKSLRESVSSFVSGYDSADPVKASAFALRDEWQNEDEDAQYRVEGGYSMMINYLADESRKNGADIFLETIVKEIHWENSLVRVVSSEGKQYCAEKTIIALPLGVLRVKNISKSAIAFDPPIGHHSKALEQMGFGSIIKILLEFKNAFWENEYTEKLAGGSLKHMAFLLSDEKIPTWWTQFPNHSTVLTGWLGGPPAEQKKHMANEKLLKLGLQSLANIFKVNADDLESALIAWNVVNWTIDPFTLGSYAYDTVDSSNARKILRQPIEDTIHFAGEYLYQGAAMGTVEAALTSGLETAGKLL